MRNLNGINYSFKNFNYALIDTSGLRQSINKYYKNLLKKLIVKENNKTEINIDEIKNNNDIYLINVLKN